MNIEKLTYSVQLNWGQGPSPTEPLWILDPYESYPVSDGEVWLRSLRTGASAGVSANVAHVVRQHCSVFNTLGGHAAVLAERVPALGGQREPALQVLRQLVEHGLLVRADQLLHGLATEAELYRPEPIEYVGIRTCDRPKLLSRLLESLRENERRHGNRYHYLISDDSRIADNSAANAHAVRQAQASGLSASYHGELEQGRLVERLCNAYPENAAAIRFLLAPSEGGFTGGRIFNHLFLLTAGRRLVTLDDDSVCRAYQLRDPDPVEVSRRAREIWFFDDLSSAFSSTAETDIDPIAEHGSVVGASLAQVLRRGLSREGVSQEVLRHLRTEDLASVAPDSKVLVSYNGVLGDPGSGSSAWLYTQEGEAAERFWADSENAYQRNRTARMMYVGVPGPRLYTNAPLMTTTATGLDNRNLLPPFSPVGRMEDFFFVCLMKACYPRMLSCELPWGLGHLPDPWRTWGDAQLSKPLEIGTLDYLGEEMALAGTRLMTEDTERRMGFLAQTLRDLASAEQRALEDRLQRLRLIRRAGQVRLLRARLGDGHRGPEYWRRDMRQMLEANQRALALQDRPLLGDAEGGGLDGLRRLLSELANGLEIWPTLWEHMRGENGR